MDSIVSFTKGSYDVDIDPKHGDVTPSSGLVKWCYGIQLYEIVAYGMNHVY